MSESDDLRKVVLDVTEELLRSQLEAVRRLQKSDKAPPRPRKGMSQVDMVLDILHREAGPLHISEILDRVRQVHQVSLDRESVVSALTKRMKRDHRLVRTGANVFDLNRS